VEVYVAVISHL